MATSCNKLTQHVVIIANQWSRNGGLEIVTQDFARAFAELGWCVTVLPASGVGVSEILENGIRVKWLPPSGRVLQSLWHRYLKWPILSWETNRLLKNGGLLILGHVHLLPVLDGLTANKNIARWIWVHGIDVWGRAAEKWRPYLNQMDKIVAVSRYTAEHVRGAGVTSQISVVLNRVDTRRFIPTAMPEKIRREEILICGRMSVSEQYKGHEVLFEALPIAEKMLRRQLVIRVIGAGDDMHRLQNKINTMGLKEKVIFSGRVTDDELLEAYQHCGVFVMPSRVEYDGHTDSWAGEGFGLVYVEAEACGRPVVCSADGGAAETIIDGKTGLLVDPRSPLKVAEAIARILGDPEFADKLGRAGREHAVSSHSFDRFKLRIAEMLIADK
jgi:phosphatidylinositol alpha-1,6-mannosyltransferase